MHAVHKRAVLGVGGRGRVSSSAQVNYYAVLEVDVEASAEDIKRAYRQRAKQLHPDLNRSPGADKAFRLLKRAHDVLSDKMLRTEHDRQLDLPSARASDPRFARFERWRREVVPDLRLQLDVWGAEIYLMLSTAQKTLWMQEQQTQDLLRVKPDTDRQAAAAGAIVESMRGILQDALSNVQRLYEKRYQQVEVRYPAYPAIVWYDVWEEVSEEWLAAANKLNGEWQVRIQSLADSTATSTV